MINGEIYRNMVISAANVLDNDKEKINSLNVFPVPDGDTGINMSLTMQAAKKNLIGFKGDLSQCADTVASSLLRGARGNSGVILSLFFRGIAKGLKGFTEADNTAFANAMKNGVDAAYKAVRQPTEGTILTVMRLSADAAVEFSENDNEDFLEFFSNVYETACETLAKTPEMLPVLEQANVVDAGGKGLCTVFSGMLYYLKNNSVVESEATEADKPAETASFDTFNTEDIKFAYCTECIVDKKSDISDNDISYFESVVRKAGDSDVFVVDSDIIKVHVHTNDPGKVLSAALRCGSLATIKVENMKIQHSEVLQNTEPKKNEVLKPTKKYGFVTVAAGQGLCDLMRDLGADIVVEGGQTMNPSTEDIIKAIEKTPSENVFVLPNNKNIYMAAKQAEELVPDKKVIVLRSVSVPEGITAMLSFNEEDDVDANVEAMKTAMEGVKTCQITFAARDSVFEGETIKEGQILGLVDGKVCFVEDKKLDCMEKIANELTDYSFITVYYGADIKEEEANEAVEFLKTKLTDKEIVLVNGGQPVYYYMISAE